MKKSKEEYLLTNGVMAYDLGKVEKQVMKAMDDYLDGETTELKKQIEKLNLLINNPELNNFIEAIKIESAHQTERWGREHEENSPPHHYVLVANKLLGKIATSIFDSDSDKFKHHCITLASMLHNCHRQIDKAGTQINKWFKK